MSGSLTQEKSFVFRITHRDNVPWIMANGLHCRNANKTDPNFVAIGNLGLIEDRHTRQVPCKPFGTLSDYVPFYFTPFTPMAYNIKTGYRGVRQRPSEEIVIFVSSLPTLQSAGVRFVFTDRHAYLRSAQFSSNLADLDRIDWGILKRRDFRHDPEDPEKTERYQAEALVHGHLPISAILGVLCYNDLVAANVKLAASNHGQAVQAVTKPGWYV
jgi:ssDNA thymidine ADP-ribosyltransferase, DarT